jgi:predicted site-specific integrase-resolvase
MAAPPEPWRTAKELAQREHVSLRTIYRWSTVGIVERSRHGTARRVRYRIRSPEEYRVLKAIREGRTETNKWGELVVVD